MKLKRFESPGISAGYSFWCAGCNERHAVNTESFDGKQRPVWSFNGDLERPVIGPSVLVTTTRHKTMTDVEWEEYDRLVEEKGQNAAMNDPRFRYVCHTFVGSNGAAPGQIIYLGDCTHALAGQTIDLPDMPA